VLDWGRGLVVTPLVGDGARRSRTGQCRTYCARMAGYVAQRSASAGSNYTGFRLRRNPSGAGSVTIPDIRQSAAT